MPKGYIPFIGHIRMIEHFRKKGFYFNYFVRDEILASKIDPPIAAFTKGIVVQVMIRDPTLVNEILVNQVEKFDKHSDQKFIL